MAATITVTCPNCKNRMRASSDYIGRKGRCPSCKSLVEIRPGADDSSVVTTYPSSGTADAQATRSQPASTEVSSWLAGLIGLLATLILYLCVFYPLKNTSFGELFVYRSFIPYIVVLVTCWGLSLLALKYVAVKRQQSFADLELELIPLEIGLQITPANVEQFLDHLGQAPAVQRQSILGRRITGALEHFRSRNSVPEVQEYLSTQAEIDASTVDAGYTMLRAFIWAVPILGFIGTVIGISGAVSELSTTLASGAEIREGIGGVTTGLATAFDTTLVALAMAILLLFPTESLRKSEYQMLDRIEGFANEQLLRRMADEHTGADLENMPDIVKQALESAFQEHQRWLAQWQAQVAELGRVVGADFEQAFSRMQENLAESESARLGNLDEVSHLLSKILDGITESTNAWQQRQNEFGSGAEQLSQAAEKLGATLSETAGCSRELVELQAKMLDQYQAGDVAGTMQELRREIDVLVQRLSLPADGDAATLLPESARDSSEDGHVGGGDGTEQPRRGVFGFLRGRTDK